MYENIDPSKTLALMLFALIVVPLALAFTWEYFDLKKEEREEKEATLESLATS